MRCFKGLKIEGTGAWSAKTLESLVVIIFQLYLSHCVVYMNVVGPLLSRM